MIFNCKYCNKECKNKNSLVQHEIRCKLNPNKIQVVNHRGKNNPMYGKSAWNKGLTKETDERVKKYGETYHIKYINGSYHILGKGKTIEKEKIRKYKLSQHAKLKNNFWKCRKKHLIEYNNIKFDSSYEVIVAQSLDKYHINWKKCKSFKYIDKNNIEHEYTPDFYLPDFNIYLDPKNDFLINNINPNLGFKDTDKIKWVCKQNNIRVIILNKNQLDWNIIKTLI